MATFGQLGKNWATFSPYLVPLSKAQVDICHQCDQIWPNFDTLAKFISICKVLGIVLVWNLANFCTYFLICNTTVQIFTDINGHRVKNNVAIWSHCMPPTLINF